MTARLVVLASGNGSNFQAVVDATRTEPRLDAEVVALVCNVPHAFVLTRATHAGVPTVLLPAEHGEARPDYDARLLATVTPWEPDYVILAGWMRLLSMTFLRAYPQRVVNLHPALPGKFPGTGAVERALDAAQRRGLDHTGVMVHFVPDEGMDDGPVIATTTVHIRQDDTLDTLSERVHASERTLLVSALRTLIAQR